jgi:hypothetical protein
MTTRAGTTFQVTTASTSCTTEAVPRASSAPVGTQRATVSGVHHHWEAAGWWAG